MSHAGCGRDAEAACAADYLARAFGRSLCHDPGRSLASAVQATGEWLRQRAWTGGALVQCALAAVAVAGGQAWAMTTGGTAVYRLAGDGTWARLTTGVPQCLAPGDLLVLLSPGLLNRVPATVIGSELQALVAVIPARPARALAEWAVNLAAQQPGPGTPLALVARMGAAPTQPLAVGFPVTFPWQFFCAADPAADSTHPSGDAATGPRGSRLPMPSLLGLTDPPSQAGCEETPARAERTGNTSWWPGRRGSAATAKERLQLHDGGTLTPTKSELHLPPAAGMAAGCLDIASVQNAEGRIVAQVVLLCPDHLLHPDGTTNGVYLLLHDLASGSRWAIAWLAPGYTPDCALHADLATYGKGALLYQLRGTPEFDLGAGHLRAALRLADYRFADPIRRRQIQALTITLTGVRTAR